MNPPAYFKALKFIVCALCGTFFLVMSFGTYAQPPGQDTITLTTAPSTNGSGASPERPGKGLDEKEGMPIGLKAKIARYTALSMSKGDETQAMKTNTARAESFGFNKTCVQDINGATTPAGMSSGRYGPRGQDQVTVLRGDFINVCR